MSHQELLPEENVLLGELHRVHRRPVHAMSLRQRIFAHKPFLTPQSEQRTHHFLAYIGFIME